MDPIFWSYTIVPLHDISIFFSYGKSHADSSFFVSMASEYRIGHIIGVR